MLGGKVVRECGWLKRFHTRRFPLKLGTWVSSSTTCLFWVSSSTSLWWSACDGGWLEEPALFKQWFGTWADLAAACGLIYSTLIKKGPPKWRKCESVWGNGPRGWRQERAMDRMDRPRTSIDERMLSRHRVVVIVWWAVAGFGRFSLTSCCPWQPHSASWAWTSACSPTGALLHCCFPSNLSTTAQGAIVKMHGASPELWGRGVRQRVMCTLDYYQCWAVKPCLPWSVNCPGVYWEEGRWGWRVLGSQEVGTMKS